MRRWFLAAAGLAAALGVLQLFRYQPMTAQPDYYWLHVWDRLRHRDCVTPRPQTTNVTGIACNKQEVEALITQIDRADQLEEKQAADTGVAEAYKRALAIAGGDPALAKRVDRLRQAGFSDAEISDYAAVEHIEKAQPILAPRIEKARAMHISDAAILTAIRSHRPQ